MKKQEKKLREFNIGNIVSEKTKRKISKSSKGRIVSKETREKTEHMHHIKPQKLEPFFSLDPDYCIACCSKCHYEKGHKDECGTGKLSKLICNK